MKKVSLFILPLIVTLLWNCREKPRQIQHTQKKSGNQTHYFRISEPLVKLNNTKVLDTFTLWRDLYRLLEINDSLNEEELKDKLELVHDKIIHIQRQKFPPRLDTADIKSRLLLLLNENRQLKWILEKKYVYPSPDSIFQRYITARNGLFRQINYLAADTVNYERIFKEKAQRDKAIEEIFKKDMDTGRTQIQPDTATSFQILPVKEQR